MKPNYLETYHFRKLEDYCKNKCINIVFEQNSVDDELKKLLRGSYKGYLYSKKVSSKLLQGNKRVLNFELYNHFKYYKTWKARTLGEEKALYDILNFISNEF